VKYHHDYIGYNSRLDTLQAAILRVKLKKTDEAIAARARYGAHYTARLSGLPGLRIPGVALGNRGVFYVYNILLDGRDALAARFKEKGIGYSIYYPMPLHLQKCFAYLGYKEGDFPVAESVARRIIALPIYPEITDEEVDYVCDEIAAFCRA
jgi:dTDP-4-amino-4,6-dideoxygalactose transaminase